MGKYRTVAAQQRFGESRKCVVGMSLMKGHSAVNAANPNRSARFRCHVVSELCYGFNRESAYLVILLVSIIVPIRVSPGLAFEKLAYTWLYGCQ